MGRVSKSKAAAREASGSAVPKRTPSKRTRVVEDNSDADDAAAAGAGEVDTKAPSPAPAPVKNGKKKEDVATDESADESDEAESFEVEAILSSRARHGKRQFKIRWKGFGPADDTWEDEENIDSPELVAAFLKGPAEEEVSKAAAKSPKKQSKKGKAASSKTKPSPAKKAKVADDADEDTEWEVSKVVDYVNLKDGTRQFLVQWKGYSSKQNSWEPEANLNCPQLIDKFLLLEKEREDSTRKTREVRKQVYKYNPDLVKRSSQRSSTKKRVSYHDLE